MDKAPEFHRVISSDDFEGEIVAMLTLNDRVWFATKDAIYIILKEGDDPTQWELGSEPLD